MVTEVLEYIEVSQGADGLWRIGWWEKSSTEKYYYSPFTAAKRSAMEKYARQLEALHRDYFAANVRKIK